MFSVVIPAYNRADLLAQTIRSVFAQECTDFEVIVVDDGSSENLGTVLEQFGSGVRLVHQENRGPGAARNLGIAHANGEYIAFLDSDDLWFPWTLKTYRNVIEKCSKPAVVAACLRHFASAEELVGVPRKPLEYEIFDDYLTAARRGRFFGAGQLLVRKDAITSVGGFTELRINAEDHDLALRLGVASGFVFIDSPVMVGYRQHPDSETVNISKAVLGVRNLLFQEQVGNYAGGNDRRVDRWHIITTHSRSFSLAALDTGSFSQAWALYWSTFTWHVWRGRWRYLFGFPVRALLEYTRHVLRRKPTIEMK